MIVIEQAMEIIKSRSAHENGVYDPVQVRWWLDGLLFREGAQAVLNAPKTTPFRQEKGRYSVNKQVHR